MTYMEMKMIGSKIAEARKRLNISQAQLAQQLFISAQAVGKWERGESIPDLIMFNRLAKILGVDLNYFSEDFAAAPQASDDSRTEPGSSEGAQQSASSAEQAKNKPSWDMSQGNWVDADFSGLKNLQEKFSSSNMKDCRFIGSDLSGLLLKNNNVNGCDFSGSDICKSRVQGSNLVGNLFKDSSLKETDFSGSNIERCDFSGAGLTGAAFSKSYLYACDFTDADLSGVVMKSGGFSGERATDQKEDTLLNAVWNGTSFIDTQIADVAFTGVLEDCYFENCKFTRVQFRKATLVNTFFKNNQNLKRVQFTDCQADRMTYEFLKSGKANLEGITVLTA